MAGWPFGQKDAASVQSDDRHAIAAANRQHNLAELAKIVQTKEPEARGKSDDLLAAAWAEHRRQVAGFRFEARRWGEFIEISIRRDQEGEQTYSVSLRLPDLTTAKLEPGHEPDEKGEVRYNPNIKGATGWWSGTGGSGWTIEGERCSLDDAVDPASLDATPSLPTIPKTRRFADIPPPPAPPQQGNYGSLGGWISTMSGGGGYGGSSYGREFTSSGSLEGFTNFARPAVDDRIVFSKAGVTIYAPAGQGRAVLEKIMLASGKDASGHR